jgi:RimJ/RimL family protein N-acetyltransferase
VQALLQWLKTRGCRRVCADVMPGNAASIALLRKLGFIETSEDDNGDLIFVFLM